MDIKSLLGLRPKDDSAEALKRSLSDAQAKRQELNARIAALQARRASVLLDGDAAAVEALERELDAFRADLERVSVVIDALPARVAEAERREEALRLDALEQEARALSDEGLTLISGIEDASRTIFRLVEQHDVLVRRQVQMNRELRAAGRKHVPVPVQRAWGTEGVSLGLSELAPTLSLPSPWGGARTAESLDAQIMNARAGSVGGGLHLPWPCVMM